MMESFFGTLQLELLDRRSSTRAELASAIFEWIEGWSRAAVTPRGDLRIRKEARRRRGSGMMSTRERPENGSGSGALPAAVCVASTSGRKDLSWHIVTRV